MPNTIYYIMDPLCGWCYGFSSVINQLEVDFKHKYQFTLVCGGMIVGDREGPINPDMAKYILGAIPRVTETTGAAFGEPFKKHMAEAKIYQSSIKPSKAIKAYQKLQATESAIAFAGKLQKKWFIDGLDFQDDATYTTLATDVGLDAALFLATIKAPEAETAMNADFAQTKTWGVGGFPCVVLHKDDKFYALTNGYSDYKSIAKLL